MNRQQVVIAGVGGMSPACADRLGEGRCAWLLDASPERLCEIECLSREERHEIEVRILEATDSTVLADIALAVGAAGALRALAHTAGVSPSTAPVQDGVAIAQVADSAFHHSPRQANRCSERQIPWPRSSGPKQPPRR